MCPLRRTKKVQQRGLLESRNSMEGRHADPVCCNGLLRGHPPPDGPADLRPKSQCARILRDAHKAANKLHVELLFEVLPEERCPGQPAGEGSRRWATEVEPLPIPFPGQQPFELRSAFREPGIFL